MGTGHNGIQNEIADRLDQVAAHEAETLNIEVQTVSPDFNQASKPDLTYKHYEIFFPLCYNNIQGYFHIFLSIVQNTKGKNQSPSLCLSASSIPNHSSRQLVVRSGTYKECIW